MERSKTKTKAPDARDVEVGRRIRSQRLVSRMSQTELANNLGVTFQQVQKYEKGVNRVGAGRLSRIADVLSVPVSFLSPLLDSFLIAGFCPSRFSCMSDVRPPPWTMKLGMTRWKIVPS